METNEENIFDNFVYFSYGGAGAGSRTFAPAPAKKYRLRNTACTRVIQKDPEIF